MTDTEKRGENLRFSRREWLMLIAIICVLEAWILNVSYVFQSEQAVINYVSFAATIASLLLAVIAIIYGYYQSDGQQKAAAAMSSQIDSMRSVQKELNQASQGISEQLSGMTLTASELKKLSESLDGTHQVLGEMGGNISGLAAEQRALKEMVSSQRIKSADLSEKSEGVLNQLVVKKNAVETLFKRTSFDSDLFGVALYGLLEKKVSTTLHWTEFVEKHYAQPISQPDKPGSLIRYSNIGLELMLISKSFGLVNFDLGDESNLQVSEGIRDELKAVFEGAMWSQHTKDRAALVLASFK